MCEFISHIVPFCMDKSFIAKRVSRIREAKNRSARSLSLDLGMSSEYINQVENGKLNPSLDFISNFCDYFKIPLGEFFDYTAEYPIQYRELIKDLNKLAPDELAEITAVVKRIADFKG